MPPEKSGFSLIEVVIAVVIMGFMTLAVMTGSMAVRKATESTVYQAVAESVTAGFMEQLKGEEYGVLRNKALGADTSPFEFIILNYGVQTTTDVLKVPINTQGFVQLFGVQGIPVSSSQSKENPGQIRVRTRMDYEFRITLTAHPTLPVVSILLEYRYRDPQTKEMRSHRMVGARASVSR